jgi:hypothetical protein
MEVANMRLPVPYMYDPMNPLKTVIPKKITAALEKKPLCPPCYRLPTYPYQDNFSEQDLAFLKFVGVEL